MSNGQQRPIIWRKNRITCLRNKVIPGVFSFFQFLSHTCTSRCTWERHIGRKKKRWETRSGNEQVESGVWERNPSADPPLARRSSAFSLFLLPSSENSRIFFHKYIRMGEKKTNEGTRGCTGNPSPSYSSASLLLMETPFRFLRNSAGNSACGTIKRQTSLRMYIISKKSHEMMTTRFCANCSLQQNWKKSRERERNW